MKDTIIKNTGNSRFLRSSVSQDITFSEFITLLRAGQLPIDLAGINEDGIDVLGTALNKFNLLKDRTAVSLGLTVDAVPDDAFSALLALSMKDRAAVTIQISLSNGTPIRGVPISGTGIDSYAYTDENGFLMLLYDTTTTETVSLSIVQPYDLTDFEFTTIELEIKSQDIFTYRLTGDQKELAGTTKAISTGPLFLTELAPLAEFWGCGGGASGAVGGFAYRHESNYVAGENYEYQYYGAIAATAGAGGKVASFQETELTNRFYSVTVGAGGKKVSSGVDTENDTLAGSAGKAGGTTKMVNVPSGVTKLSASGGAAGKIAGSASAQDSRPSTPITASGANGGSGSGGCCVQWMVGESAVVFGASGTNGADGASVSVTVRDKTYTARGGTGQGVSAYPFGDSDVLCCSAGTVVRGAGTATGSAGSNPGDGGDAAMPYMSSLPDIYNTVKTSGVSGAGAAGVLYARFAG